jgi:hypothetical protein
MRAAEAAERAQAVCAKERRPSPLGPLEAFDVDGDLVRRVGHSDQSSSPSSSPWTENDTASNGSA